MLYCRPITLHAHASVAAFVGAVVVPLLLLFVPVLSDWRWCAILFAGVSFVWTACVCMVVEMFTCEPLGDHFAVLRENETA